MPEAVDEVATRKTALRQELRQKRRALPEADSRAASEAVCRHVASLRAFQRARSLALYAAARGEIDVTSLAAPLTARGAVVAWPRIVTREPPLLAFHTCPLSDLIRDAMGIPTPPATAPDLGLAKVEVVLVPGVAFDVAGRRLGQGGGYYDHSLAAAPDALRVGVCHTFQLIDAVPHYASDVAVDLIVTPDGARNTGARSHPLVEDLS